MTLDCTYCPEPATVTDHVRPLALDGEDAPPNKVPACAPCNASKGASLLTAWDVDRVAYGITHSAIVAAEYARLLIAGTPPPAPQLERPTRTTGVHVPVALVGRMRAAVEVENVTNAFWLMEALNEVWDVLEERYPPLPARRPELPAARRQPRRGMVDLMPINFRLTRSEVAALDRRQAQLAVPSRSELVTAIIELRLGQSASAAA